MNERLKAWCERRMTDHSTDQKAWFACTTATEGLRLTVYEDGGWALADFPAWHRLPGEPTPEKVETLASMFGLVLRGGGGERSDSLVQLACAALSAADGLDPTLALALADEVIERNRYPEITPEWLSEIGWYRSKSIRTPGFWFHDANPIRDVGVLETSIWEWTTGNRDGGYGGWYSQPRRTIANRGDLLKLMELFGHDWKNPPRAERPETYTNELGEEMTIIPEEDPELTDDEVQEILNQVQPMPWPAP